jgi:hypothetical protein
MQVENAQWGRDYLLTFKNPENGVLITVKDLRIQFDISLYVDNRTNTNKGTISIYNLKDETLSLINTRFGTISLDAGYQGNIKNIVTADVINIKTSKSGGDTVTTFELIPGFVNTGIKRVGVTFPDEISLQSVIEKVASELQLGLATTNKGDWTSIKCTYGYTAMGTGKQVLDDLAKTYAIEWNIQDGKLVVTDRYATSDKAERAVILDKESGLIDIPFMDSEEISKAVGQALDKEDELFIKQKKLKPKKDGTQRLSKKITVVRWGIRAKALLNPEIRPNSLFKVVTTNKVFDNYYRVRTVNFKGDSRGGDWVMELYGDSVDATEMGK